MRLRSVVGLSDGGTSIFALFIFGVAETVQLHDDDNSRSEDNEDDGAAQFVKLDARQHAVGIHDDAIFRVESANLRHDDTGQGVAHLLAVDVCTTMMHDAHAEPLHASVGGRTFPLLFHLIRSGRPTSYKEELSWKRRLLCAVVVRPVQTKVTVFRPYIDVVVHRREVGNSLWHGSNAIPTKSLATARLRVFVHLIHTTRARVIGECSFGVEDAASLTCLIRRSVPFDWFRWIDDSAVTETSFRLSYTVEIDTGTSLNAHKDAENDNDSFAYLDEKIELISSFLQFTNPDYNSDDFDAVHKSYLLRERNGSTISISTVASATCTPNSMHAILLSFAPSMTDGHRLVEAEQSLPAQSLDTHSAPIFRSNASFYRIRIQIDTQRFNVESMQPLVSPGWLQSVEKQTDNNSVNVAYTVALYPAAAMTTSYNSASKNERYFLALLLRCRRVDTLYNETNDAVRFHLHVVSGNENSDKSGNESKSSTVATVENVDETAASIAFSIPKLDADYAIVPLLKHSELVNSAALSGRQVAAPLRVVAISESGRIRDVTDASHCLSGESRVVKTSPTCASVYVDGAEKRGAARVQIHVQYGSLAATFAVRVWFPRLPLTVRVDDAVLNQIANWPVGGNGKRATSSSNRRRTPEVAPTATVKGILHARIRRSDRTSGKTSRSDNATTCVNRFQQTEIRVLAAFQAVDARTGESALLTGDDALLVDVTRFVRSRVQSSNVEAIGVRWQRARLIATARRPGAARISVQCFTMAGVHYSSAFDTDSSSAIDCGSTTIMATREHVTASELSVGIVTDVRAEMRLGTISSAGAPVRLDVITRARTDFFQQFQYGVLDVRIRYSDSHDEPLADVERADYALRIYSTDNDALRVREHRSGAQLSRHYSVRDMMRHIADGALVELIAVKTLVHEAELSVELRSSIECAAEDDANLEPIALGHAVVRTTFAQESLALVNSSEKTTLDAHVFRQLARRQDYRNDAETPNDADRTTLFMLLLFGALLMIILGIVAERFGIGDSVDSLAGETFARVCDFYQRQRCCTQYDCAAADEDDGLWRGTSDNLDSHGCFAQLLRYQRGGNGIVGGGFRLVGAAAGRTRYDKMAGPIGNSRVGSSPSELSGGSARFSVDTNETHSFNSFDAHRTGFKFNGVSRQSGGANNLTKKLTLPKSVANGGFGDVAVTVETACGLRENSDSASRRFTGGVPIRSNGARKTGAAEWVWLPSGAHFRGVSGANTRHSARRDDSSGEASRQNSFSIESQYSRRSTLELSNTTNTTTAHCRDSTEMPSRRANYSLSPSPLSFSSSSSGSSGSSQQKNVTVSYRGSEISVCIGRQLSNVTVNSDTQQEAKSTRVAATKTQRSHRSFSGQTTDNYRSDGVVSAMRLRQSTGTVKRRAESYNGKSSVTAKTPLLAEDECALFEENTMSSVRSNVDIPSRNNACKVRRQQRPIASASSPKSYLSDTENWYQQLPQLNDVAAYQLPRFFDYSLPLPARLPEVLLYQPHVDDLELRYGSGTSHIDENASNAICLSNTDTTRRDSSRCIYNSAELEETRDCRKTFRQFSPPPSALASAASCRAAAAMSGCNGRLTLVASSTEDLDACLNGSDLTLSRPSPQISDRRPSETASLGGGWSSVVLQTPSTAATATREFHTASLSFSSSTLRETFA